MKPSAHSLNRFAFRDAASLFLRVKRSIEILHPEERAEGARHEGSQR
jgi:hypothetical protein